MMKPLSLLLISALIFASVLTASAAIPKKGTFDINGTAGVSFNPDPLDVQSGSVFLWVFANDEFYPDPDANANNNLARATFSGGSHTVSDFGQYKGDLGIRIGNYSNDIQTLAPTILTLDFGDEFFDVFLPEITLNNNSDNMYLWVATSGATYYANSSLSIGDPDTYAFNVMADDTALAMIPEPASMALFAVGSLLLFRKKR